MSQTSGCMRSLNASCFIYLSVYFYFIFCITTEVYLCYWLNLRGYGHLGMFLNVLAYILFKLNDCTVVLSNLTEKTFRCWAVLSVEAFKQMCDNFVLEFRCILLRAISLAKRSLTNNVGRVCAKLSFNVCIFTCTYFYRHLILFSSQLLHSTTL